MSIAIESNRMDRSGFDDTMSFKAIYDSSDSGDRRAADDDDSCSSSSIGKNSDVSGGGQSDSGDGDGEVQSSFKGPLDCLDSLEEVLPIKRGISNFYSGKSKSYTSLSDVSSCSSIKDIVKQEDAYTRKRKNLLAHSNYFDRSRNGNLGSSSGISKRLANSSRSSIALSAMVSSSESNNSSECLGSNSSSPTPSLPPLPPNGRRSKSPNNGLMASPPTPERKFSPWRSFSLSDLQHAATATTESALVNNKRSFVEE
ncbi:hypothetical protein DCAR_0728437 [Daucus carota subsp. sativus]|uniref:Uncharacterized protein n=1 Tax=Daucus carota subsp. sativus TaxID=79200 RepID=A0AAF0XM47_DAUCS|nr:PREDICTED: dentin sialophosphoprotein-like [Daucus carota subsp. sativus]WOH08986.1 hypothetical protein DCAR_0728437 [Daucus carota subsp. sativus]